MESDGFLEPATSTSSIDLGSRSSQPEKNNEHWENFVRRAEERGRSNVVNYDKQSNSTQKQWGQLWEIGCKVSGVEIIYAVARNLQIIGRVRGANRVQSPVQRQPS